VIDVEEQESGEFGELTKEQIIAEANRDYYLILQQKQIANIMNIFGTWPNEKSLREEFTKEGWEEFKDYLKNERG